MGEGSGDNLNGATNSPAARHLKRHNEGKLQYKNINGEVGCQGGFSLRFKRNRHGKVNMYFFLYFAKMHKNMTVPNSPT